MIVEASMNEAAARLNDSERKLKKSQLPDSPPAPVSAAALSRRSGDAVPLLHLGSGSAGRNSTEEPELLTVPPMTVAELFHTPFKYAEAASLSSALSLSLALSLPSSDLVD